MSRAQRGRRKAASTVRTTSAAKATRSQAELIYEVVRAIPRGRIATYGELAMLAGMHAGHRIAARAMQQCPTGLAWHRVLGKKDARRAKVALMDPEHAALQRAKLEAEGVSFDASGYVALRQFGWLSSEVGPQKRTKRAASAPRKQRNR